MGDRLAGGVGLPWTPGAWQDPAWGVSWHAGISSWLTLPAGGTSLHRRRLHLHPRGGGVLALVGDGVGQSGAAGP
ncbi:MAG: hypothetical protein KatS3mg132_589 [Limisphaera sp.]|nr:MAG: hypothetical protein KatS3mg132_589 [Limisphaera sp.]